MEAKSGRERGQVLGQDGPNEKNQRLLEVFLGDPVLFCLSAGGSHWFQVTGGWCQGWVPNRGHCQKKVWPHGLQKFVPTSPTLHTILLHHTGFAFSSSSFFFFLLINFFGEASSSLCRGWRWWLSEWRQQEEEDHFSWLSIFVWIEGGERRANALQTIIIIIIKQGYYGFCLNRSLPPPSLFIHCVCGSSMEEGGGGRTRLNESSHLQR